MAITVDMLVWAYSRGIFPMASDADGELAWYSPDPRGVLQLDRFHASRSLRKRVRTGEFAITADRSFERVIRACAEPRKGDPATWINDDIIEVFIAAHHAGMAHSIEAWCDDSQRELVGGLYGLALGGAFFGESMFSRATDASKVCLVHLVNHLNRQGYTLLDTQFLTPHLAQFGAIEIPKRKYIALLQKALRSDVSWS